MARGRQSGRFSEGIVNIKMLGDVELERALFKLGQKDAKRVVHNALRPGAKILYNNVLRAVPVRTGALLRAMSSVKDALKRFSATGRNRRKGVFGYKILTPERWRLWQENAKFDERGKWYYPAIVEYGTKDGRLKPQPFIRDSTEEVRGQVLSSIRTHIKRGIERYWKNAIKRGRKTNDFALVSDSASNLDAFYEKVLP